MKKKDSYSDGERRLWVLNDEGLYLSWKGSKLSLENFIKRKKNVIDEVIFNVISQRKPPHYLFYDKVKEKIK